MNRQSSEHLPTDSLESTTDSSEPMLVVAPQPEADTTNELMPDTNHSDLASRRKGYAHMLGGGFVHKHVSVEKDPRA